MDADVPYELAVAGGTASVVEVPIHWSLDDWEQYCYIPGVSEGSIASPATVEQLWGLELEAMRAEGGCFVLTNHPFVTGRPSRAAVPRAVPGEDPTPGRAGPAAEPGRTRSGRPGPTPRGPWG